MLKSLNFSNYSSCICICLVLFLLERWLKTLRSFKNIEKKVVPGSVEWKQELCFHFQEMYFWCRSGAKAEKVDTIFEPKQPPTVPMQKKVTGIKQSFCWFIKSLRNKSPHNGMCHTDGLLSTSRSCRIQASLFCF